MSPMARHRRGILAAQWQIAETGRTLLPLSVSDSKARALHDHRDAGLHGTVTNISQLPRATGKKKKAAKWVFT